MTNYRSDQVDQKTAAQIVQTLIDMAPRFRVPQTPEKFEEIVGHWRRALNHSGSIIPKQIYLDAVDSWLASATQETWYPAPGDILAHARKVMRQIDRDPVRGPKMRAWMENARQEKIDRNVGDDK